MTLPWGDITVKGELRERLERNIRRLEAPKYAPDKVFLTMEQSGGWPGDTEGRTLLALILEAQATGIQPRHLDDIINRLPSHLNALGYMGPVFKDRIHEQQLSGNGWMLRALCEYWKWKQTPQIKTIVSNIATHLFLPGKGEYASYPISPGERVCGKGAESGNSIQRIGRWELSSDIGCVFIGMDGLVQAYEVLRLPELLPVINEMMQRFLQMDLTAIQAQTHASLTACRALVRYAEITGQKKYIHEAEKRWALYLHEGMTENYENYNWFRRYNTWTEPCAITDSYMLAIQLWQHTRKAEYLQMAELIYYNALCRTQRHNGGFGCDNCPGSTSGTSILKVHAPEAHWCCTMRGGEGLSAAVRYTAFREGKDLYLPSYRQATIRTLLDKDSICLEMETGYPMTGQVTLHIIHANPNQRLFLPCHPWMQRLQVEHNRQRRSPRIHRGFFCLDGLGNGDRVSIRFDMLPQWRKPLGKSFEDSNSLSLMKGPLQWGITTSTPIRIPADTPLTTSTDGQSIMAGDSLRLTPVYHLLDSSIWSPSAQGIQILFEKQACQKRTP